VIDAIQLFLLDQYQQVDQSFEYQPRRATAHSCVAPPHFNHFKLGPN